MVGACRRGPTSLFFEPEGSLQVVDGSAPLPDAAEGEKAPAYLLAGHKVTQLDVQQQVLTLHNGQQVQYGKLLLATGGVPRQLSMVKALPAEVRQRVTTYRTVADFRALKAELSSPKHVAIIGGGFLGSELAVALARQAKGTAGLQVTQVFPEEGNMGRLPALPEPMDHRRAAGRGCPGPAQDRRDRHPRAHGRGRLRDRPCGARAQQQRGGAGGGPRRRCGGH